MTNKNHKHTVKEFVYVIDERSEPSYIMKRNILPSFALRTLRYICLKYPHPVVQVTLKSAYIFFWIVSSVTKLEIL